MYLSLEKENNESAFTLETEDESVFIRKFGGLKTS